MFAHHLAEDLFATCLGHGVMCAIPFRNPVTDDLHQTREWMRLVIAGYFEDLVDCISQVAIMQDGPMATPVRLSPGLTLKAA